jgi:hypothetical protein
LAGRPFHLLPLVRRIGRKVARERRDPDDECKSAVGPEHCGTPLKGRSLPDSMTRRCVRYVTALIPGSHLRWRFCNLTQQQCTRGNLTDHTERGSQSQFVNTRRFGFSVLGIAGKRDSFALRSDRDLAEAGQPDLNQSRAHRGVLWCNSSNFSVSNA